MTSENIKLRVLAALTLAIIPFGCSAWPFSRTVYVPPTTPVRLREDVKAKVWVLVDGKEVPKVLTLKEGMFVLSGD